MLVIVVVVSVLVLSDLVGHVLDLETGPAGELLLHGFGVGLLVLLNLDLLLRKLLQFLIDDTLFGELLLVMNLGLLVLAGLQSVELLLRVVAPVLDQLVLLQRFLELLLEGLGVLLGEVHPFLPLALFPDALSNGSIGEDVNTLVSLLSVNPFSQVRTSVGPHVDSVSLLLVVHVVTVVHSSVEPLVSSFAVHHVVLPLALVNSSVGPDIDALSVDGVVVPLADVLVSVGPNILPFAFFL